MRSDKNSLNADNFNNRDDPDSLTANKALENAKKLRKLKKNQEYEF